MSFQNRPASACLPQHSPGPSQRRPLFTISFVFCLPAAGYNFIQPGSISYNGLPCCDVASVRKRDGAQRHDTFSSDTGHVARKANVTRLLQAC
jgi:hypothetical protein